MYFTLLPILGVSSKVNQMTDLKSDFLADYYKGKMLTNNFSFKEMVHSDTAKREGINNVPDSPEIFENLIDLCRELQKIRDLYGPMKINSGFRSEELNAVSYTHLTLPTILLV